MKRFYDKQCLRSTKGGNLFNFTIVNVEAIFIISTLLIVFTISQGFADISEFEHIKGEWVRTEGGYTIQVEDIKPDQTVMAKYLNPKNINISEASVSKWKGLSKLFIRLQDEGYPGSTYTLFYYDQKDALVGFYYQAGQKKTYEVIFIRQSGH